MMQANSRPQQKRLTIAVFAALAAMTSFGAHADCGTGSPLTLSSGDCTIDSTTSVSGSATAITVPSGTSAGVVTNNGVVSGTSVGLYNDGTVSNLTNSGTLSATATSGSGIDNVGTIGTLTNNKTISGGDAGIYSTGTLTALSNNGTITGGNIGIANTLGTIGTLTNAGSITDTLSTESSENAGLLNLAGTIGTINNSGEISSQGSGILNYGATITTLNNDAGTITGVSAGVTNRDASTGTGKDIVATIQTLNNGGVISGEDAGIYNDGVIGTINNSGVISGTNYAIFNDSTGTLGAISDSGVIAGNIENDSTADLNINGASGTAFGSLTGLNGAVGTITNSASNVNFSSGNLLLNDNINVGSNAVNNTGATLLVENPVSITGNYNQGAGATLLVGVADAAVATGSLTGDSGYGRLVVSGSATIAQGSSVALEKLNSYAFAAGQRFVVVDAASNGTNYNESTLNYSATDFNGTVTGTDVANDGRSDLVLSLSGGGATGAAALSTVPNATASLSGLANYTGISDPALLNLYDAAMALSSSGSSSAANRAGVQLSPALQAAATRAATAPTFDALDIVSAHSNSLRIAQADSQSGISTGESAPVWGAWGQAFGGHASQGTVDQVDGYSANYGGLLLGADRAISDKWRAGGVFSYTDTAVNGTDNSAGDSTRVNAYGLIGYASYDGKPWYLNLSAGVIQQHYDSTREIGFQGFSGVANGQYNGQQYVASAEAGYPLAVGKATVTPLFSLAYSYQHQGAYSESGGNGAALSIDSTHSTSVRSNAGVKIDRTFNSGYGNIVPSLQVGWTHEYDHTRLATGASYVADPTGETAFTTVGATPVSDLADISLGVSLLRASNLTLSARYEVQAGAHFVSQTGSLRLRQVF